MDSPVSLYEEFCARLNDLLVSEGRNWCNLPYSLKGDSRVFYCREDVGHEGKHDCPAARGDS